MARARRVRSASQVTNASTAACPWGAHGQILVFEFQLLGCPSYPKTATTGSEPSAVSYCECPVHGSPGRPSYGGPGPTRAIGAGQHEPLGWVGSCRSGSPSGRAVGSDFAKVPSKLPPEELERCSELLYNQRQGQCQGSSEPQPSVAPSLSPVRASMDCLIKVTVCTVPFAPMDRGTIPRGSSPSGFGRASFGVTHPGGVMMLWL